MSDDEAFIRAIVANPGDDASRLIYADWLEERDDPRAAYLRTEIEWAKPWRDVKAPVHSKELLSLASSLETLWVMRISRPPVGVCCSHLVISDSWPTPSATVLDSLEGRLRLTLPPEHRAFLLNWNGGVPDRRGYFTAKMDRGNAPNYFDWFFSAPLGPTTAARASTKKKFAIQRHDLELSTIDLNNGSVPRENNEAAADRWRLGVRDFVSLAYDGYLGVLAIGLTARRKGKIYHINRPVLCGASPPTLIAESLPEFLALSRFRLESTVQDWVNDRA